MTASRTRLNVDVRLRERQVLFVAPDNEGARLWGVYGCPDMYPAEDGSIVQFSSDGCRSWEALTSLIGRTAEEEVAAGRDLIDAMYGNTVSYSNTRTVVTGPDRFLALYTDLNYGGERRKAIVVQEVIVEARGERTTNERE